MFLLVEAFPYLGWSLILLAAWLGASLVFPAQRLGMLLSALLAAPFAYWSILYVPEYWKPNLVAGNARVSIEDAIAGFALGGLVWLVVFGPGVRTFALCLDARQVLKRYLAINVGGTATCLAMWSCGFKVMSSFLAGASAVGLGLVWLRRDLAVRALLGGAGFTLTYAFILKAVLLIWPHFVLQWTWSNLCGLSLWGMPVEELTWAYITGAVWPLAMGYILDARAVRTHEQVLMPVPRANKTLTSCVSHQPDTSH